MSNDQTAAKNEQAHGPADIEEQTAELMWKAIMSGATLKDIHGVSDNVMEGIYAHAYKFYQQGRMKDAEVFFRFLCLYDTYNADYIMGLAATFQQQKFYEKAIASYALAFAHAKEDFRPLLHIGQCYLFMQQQQQARETFMTLLETNAPDALKAQAQAYIAAIKPTENKESAHA